MTTTAREPAFAVDVAYAPHRVTTARPADQRLVAALQLVQRRLAQEAGREARFILQFAALRPDDQDPPSGAGGCAAAPFGSGTRSSPASARPSCTSWRWCSASAAAPRR